MQQQTSGYSVLCIAYAPCPVDLLQHVQSMLGFTLTPYCLMGTQFMGLSKRTAMQADKMNSKPGTGAASICEQPSLCVNSCINAPAFAHAV